MKTNLNAKPLWIAILLTLVSSATLAAPVGQMTTFSAGSTAKAVEVNDNFTALKTTANNNDSRIGTIETTVTGGNIVLVPSTANTGNILKGAVPFLHNFGTNNTFLGVGAGNFTMTGSQNTASGSNALFSNTSGGNNTASGNNALFSNTSGYNNTAIGNIALYSNTSGNTNVAIGTQTLYNNSIGNQNIAIGMSALVNTTGNDNTAIGPMALQSNTAGIQNIAIGTSALSSNTTGGGNIALGASAGALLTTGNANIVIGNSGVAGEAFTIRIGGGTQTRAFISGIRGATTAGAAIPVLVDINGQLGTTSSSRRVKDDIADMGAASSTLMKLRPVTFHYKTDQNPKGRSLQYGLIAEEVEKVAPDLVARSANGEIETVFYQHLTPMLLNEYQKQQRLIETQTALLAKQTARVAELELERRLQTARLDTLEKQAARLTVALGRLERAGILVTSSR